MKTRGLRPFLLLCLCALSTTIACGLVNGVGGPWPPIGQTGDDGGVTPLVDGGVCPDGTHNGGDGTCFPDGECAAGFAALDDGRCAGWTQEATLSPARTRLTLTALDDGRVLAVGGLAVATAVPDAHLYDPTTGTWASLAGTIAARADHRTVVIPGNRALVAGGRDGDGALVAETAFFRADQSALVPASPLLTPRTGHALIAIGANVRVLGGRRADGTVLGSVEELASGEYRAAAFSMATPRADHETAALDDGRVLVCGGIGVGGEVLASCELIAADAQSGTVVSSMTDARTDFTLVAVSGGRVLAIGGTADEEGGFAPLRTAEVYDPVVDTWSDVGFLTVPRTRHGAARLTDGRVLVVGGFDGEDAPLASVEIYDPDAAAFVEGPSLTFARGEVALVALDDGGAIAVQGSSEVDDSAVVTTTERLRVFD